MQTGSKLRPINWRIISPIFAKIHGCVMPKKIKKLCASGKVPEAEALTYLTRRCADSRYRESEIVMSRGYSLLALTSLLDIVTSYCGHLKLKRLDVMQNTTR